MLTFFSTAKAFQGHDGVIQRNALISWTLVHPDAEVILFGDDLGASEICAELGLRHEPYVEKHESGTKLLHYMFRRATELARHPLLCYANCDIILTDDFAPAAQRACAWRNPFLLVARRWDTDITQPIDFSHANWQAEVRHLARTTGLRREEYWIDVFLFTKGLYLDMPPLIVGHCFWDNWMIWKAILAGIPVIDGSRAIIPIHQNHVYNPRFGRTLDSPNDPLSQLNLQQIGGKSRILAIDSATHYLSANGEFRINLWHYVVPIFPKNMRNFLLFRLWLPFWHLILNLTRPLRHAIGFRKHRGARSTTRP